MNNSSKLYSLVIGYSLIFTSFLLASGLWLFILSENAPIKSLEGVLERVVPHLFAMSILAFVLSHFLLFIQSIEKKKVLKFIVVLYLAIFFENLSEFLISLEWQIAMWMHLFSLIVMVFGFCWLIYTIGVDIKKSKNE